jgi:hypothetical protein
MAKCLAKHRENFTSVGAFTIYIAHFPLLLRLLYQFLPHLSSKIGGEVRVDPEEGATAHPEVQARLVHVGRGLTIDIVCFQ